MMRDSLRVLLPCEVRLYVHVATKQYGANFQLWKQCHALLSAHKAVWLREQPNLLLYSSVIALAAKASSLLH